MGLAREVDDACVTGCGTEGAQTSAGEPRGGAGGGAARTDDAAEDGRSGAGDAVRGMRDVVPAGGGTWCWGLMGRGGGHGRVRLPH